jgi:hypothetical protein
LTPEDAGQDQIARRQRRIDAAAVVESGRRSVVEAILRPWFERPTGNFRKVWWYLTSKETEALAIEC